MLSSRRVMAVVGFLAVAVIITNSQVWCDTSPVKEPKDITKPSVSEPEALRFSDKMVPSRFAEKPLSLYTSTKGEHTLAVQMLPN